MIWTSTKMKHQWLIMDVMYSDVALNTGARLYMLNFNRRYPFPPPDALSAVLQLGDGASVVPSTVTSSAMPSSCPGGFVQCSDGQCEPFEALCGEGGIVTVVFPTEITTEEATTVVHSASPIVDGTTIATLLSSTALVTQTSAETTSAVPLTTTTVVVATDSSGKEICLDGWEQCQDGTCEPFHWLCDEHGGSVNFTTKTTLPPPFTNTATLTTEYKTEVTSPGVSEIPTTTRKPVINEVLTTTATSQLPQATVSSGITGSCPSGFVQCVDGNCEPFEALCGESGVVTVTFPNGASTTMTQASVSAGLATSDSISGIQTTDAEIMQTSTTVATTTTLATVTDSSGNEICLKGWEQCADGTCEPFHWMCTEHDTNTAIIG